MTRIISIAAAILMTGFVGGGAYLTTNNKESNRPENVTQQSVTETTAANTEETTEAATKEQNDTISMTKEELIKKTKDNNSLYCFDKLSADYIITWNEFREYHTAPETYTGKVYLDEVNMTASGTEQLTVGDDLIHRFLYSVDDKQMLTGEEYWGEFDRTTGGYNLFEESYRFKDETDESDVLADRVYIPGITCGRSVIWYGTEADEWDITGERTENGRRIVSISGVHKGDNNYEGVYREVTYKGEIDAATGMTISYVTYDESGKMTYSYEVTNYKFDDEAEAFKTAEEVTNEIENGGYIQRHIGY